MLPGLVAPLVVASVVEEPAPSPKPPVWGAHANSTLMPAIASAHTPFRTRPSYEAGVERRKSRTGMAPRASGVEGSMKAVSSLLALMTLAACTSAPREESLELVDESHAWIEGSRSVPDAELVPAPPPPPEPAPMPELVRDPSRYDGPPRIAVGPYRRWWSDDDGMGAALCPFEVQSLGFPAVTVEGDTVISAIAENLSASDGEDEMMHVRWHDVDDDTVESEVMVYDGGNGWDEGQRHQHCRSLWQGARAQAEAINRRLAERSWRSLRTVELSIHEQDWATEEERAELLAAPVAERPVELLHLGGSVVARIPGMKVLERTEVSWRAPWNQYCDSTPHLREVWADRETGTVAVTYDHSSGACFCDPPTLTGVLRWSEETFEAIVSRTVAETIG